MSPDFPILSISKLSWKKEIDENGYALYSCGLLPIAYLHIEEWTATNYGRSRYLKSDRSEKDKIVFAFGCQEFSSFEEAAKYVERKIVEVFKPLVESFEE